MKNEVTPQLLRFVLDYYGDLPKALKKFGYHVKNNGQMFCPFHQNDKTEAAHLYQDDLGYCIYCFNEKKLYGYFDLLETVYKTSDVYKLAELKWNSLSQQEKENIENLINIERDYVELPFKEDLQLFKQNKISYKQLMNHIVNKMQDTL